jgi:parallel beta-helix repeat protein
MKKEFAIVIAAVILLSVLTTVPINSQVIVGNEICFQDSAYSSYDYSSLGNCPNSVILKEKTISPSDKFEISSSSITSAECKESGIGIKRRRVEIEYEYCIRALPTCPPGTYNVTGHFDFDCIPSIWFDLSPNLYSHTITVEPSETPSACFTVSPSQGDLDTIFNVDASCSSDLKDSIAALQVRWDWENDGIYDTSYSTTKITAHQYTTIGIKTIKLQVKDTDGNAHTTKKTVIVGNIDFSGTDNIKLYLTANHTSNYLSNYPNPLLIKAYEKVINSGEYRTWGNYSLKGDINGTSYSYRLYLGSDSSTTFKIEVIINGTTVATFPLLTVPYDPYYQPFSGNVIGLDPTTQSGDEVMLKITKISGGIGSISYAGTASYITIPPLVTQRIIQSKIDAAEPGDTIIIEDGIYTENVKVNKRLTIQSKNGPDKTIIQAVTPDDPVFKVTADYVNIRGFTVKRADTGIYLYNADYCNISNNNCSNNEEGIYLYESSNNLFKSNNVSNNRRITSFVGTVTTEEVREGIMRRHITTGLTSVISANGICLFNSSNNKIYLNNFINNTVYSSDSTNIWNSQSKMTYTYNGGTYTNYLGNYWDDYKEKYLDADEIDECGIWDTPYTINSDKDNYPLMEPFENYLAPTKNVSDTG